MPAVRGLDDAFLEPREAALEDALGERGVLRVVVLQDAGEQTLDTLLDYARTSGADYLIVEEYVVRGLRPQLAPLLDARTLADEPRVRLVYATRPSPGEGVAVLEVVR